MAAPLPFTRTNLPDPATNRALQDVYDKLAQVQAQFADIQTRLSALEARITALET